jgi:hypothetical protein
MALYDFEADLILADSLYWVTLPLLVGPRHKRPAIAHLGVSVVNIGSGKNIPMRPGESQEQREAELQLRERFFSPHNRPSTLLSPALVIPSFHAPSSKP